MSQEGESELDKFLYGDEFANNLESKSTIEVVNSENDGFDEEEEEDDYEIILDSSKLPTGSQAASSADINKRSLTSVAIGEDKGDEAGVSGSSDQKSSGPAVAVSHFDPFAPGNLNGVQIFDHELDNFEDKPWRKPGADLTDYFNFGFNETTWRAYCVKQKALREEFGLQKKIGVYDSSAAGGGGPGGAGFNASTSSINTNASGYRPLRRPPPVQGQSQGYQSGYQTSHQLNYQSGYQGQGGYNNRSTNEQMAPPPPPSSSYREYQQGHGHGHSHSGHHTRSHHDSPSPPPPPPPSSRHISSRDRSRSRSRSPDSTSNHRSSRYVSSGQRSSRYDDAPRSPPSKRRRD